MFTHTEENMPEQQKTLQEFYNKHCKKNNN